MSNANLVKTGRLRRSPQGQGTLYPLLQTAKSAQPKPVFRVLEDSATSDAFVPKTEQAEMSEEKAIPQNASVIGHCESVKSNPSLPLLRSILPTRFLKKINFRADGCWIWIGAKWGHPRYPHDKYGQFRDGDARTTAHRFAYQCVHGPVGRNLDVDHLCHNKLCVNPDHLEAVTHQENIKRMYRRRAK